PLMGGRSRLWLSAAHSGTNNTVDKSAADRSGTTIGTVGVVPQDRAAPHASQLSAAKRGGTTVKTDGVVLQIGRHHRQDGRRSAEPFV
ncbi:unnamed protein product, partial [Nesidiocoris tenuis]